MQILYNLFKYIQHKTKQILPKNEPLRRNVMKYDLTSYSKKKPHVVCGIYVSDKIRNAFFMIYSLSNTNDLHPEKNGRSYYERN